MTQVYVYWEWNLKSRTLGMRGEVVDMLVIPVG